MYFLAYVHVSGLRRVTEIWLPSKVDQSITQVGLNVGH